MTPQAALLLLGDGRLPIGGYAHSGGFEATVYTQGLADAADIEAFLEGRATTVGPVNAAFAAAACQAARSDDRDALVALDAELDARTPSHATRRVSRALGRQLRRGLASIQPHPLLNAGRPDTHQAIAWGVAAAVFDLTPRDAARLAIHDVVAGPVAAALKVLSVDLFAVYGAFAWLTPLLDGLIDEAAAHADTPPAELPATGAPLLDLAAEHHASMGGRLFAS